MCSTPDIPTTTATVEKQPVAPTFADASVTKASVNAKNKSAKLAGRDIKTSARGLLDDATTTKKQLLGD